VALNGLPPSDTINLSGKNLGGGEKKMEILQGVLVMLAIGGIPGLAVIAFNEYLMRKI
jgi:hypothetical protein